MKELKFNIFGAFIAVTGEAGAWRAFYFGAEGKRRPADFIIPGDVAEAGLCDYLADLLHENATPRNNSAQRLHDDNPQRVENEACMIEIRATTEADWPALKHVRLAALLDAPTAFGVTHADAAAYTDEQWRDRAAGRGPARYLLAFVDGRADGIVAHVPVTDRDLNLIAMWLAPAWRGSPVASRLVDAVKTHAAEHGYARVLLDVSPDNQRAATFYQKLGFSFLPEWEPLESHPHIQVQKMAWQVAAG